MNSTTDRQWPAVMVDIETMGTSPGAPILEIAAVVFDPAGTVGKSFKVSITLGSNEQYGRTMEAETLLWWAKRWNERGSVPELSEGMEIADALGEFVEFLHQNLPIHYEVWARGSLDTLVLEHAIRSVLRHDAMPWHYGAVRDVRTLAEWYGIKKPRATTHDALQDCFDQIQTVWEAAKAMAIGKKLERRSIQERSREGWEAYRASLFNFCEINVPAWDHISLGVKNSFYRGIEVAGGDTWKGVSQTGAIPKEFQGTAGGAEPEQSEPMSVSRQADRI